MIRAVALLCVAAPAAMALNPSVDLRQYAIRTWRKQDGLPGSRVIDVLQTRDGYLWAGTSDGLARFDGKRFVCFDLQKLTGRASNGIRKLLEDRRGRLWVGTSNGLVFLENGVFRSIDRFIGTGITGLVEDREGVLWIATQAGLHRYREDGDRTYSVADGLAANNVFSLALGGDGSIWFGTDRGAGRFLNGRFATYGSSNGLPGNIVTSVHSDRQGNIWVGTTRGLSRFGGGVFVKYEAETILQAISIMALTEDRDRNLWIGGTNSCGPVRMQGNNFAAFPSESTAADLIVYSYAEDREGTLWMATSDGLQQIRDRPFTTLTTADGLPANNIRVVYATKEGAIWMGANRSGLARFKDRQTKYFNLKDGLSALGISALIERQNGDLIAGTTYHGLNLLRGKRWTPTLGGVLPSERITGLLEDARGDLWVGTEDEGAVRIHDGQAETYSRKQGLGSSFISKLANGPHGEVWIGTDHGLRVWGNGAVRPADARDEFRSSNVNGLLAGRDGAMWIATTEGLYRFFEGRTEHFRAEQGMPDGPAGQPVEDNEGKLWFFSSAGLTRFTPSVGSASEIFGVMDGLASDSHGGPPQHLAKSPDGKLWIATARGLSMVDPTRLTKNRLPPPVRIEEILADGHPMEEKGPLKLVANTHTVEIRYTALSLAIPERVRFKYRLEGFDTNWREAGAERFAIYTNLPPREYRFQVLASNNDGVWNTTGAMLGFVQEPHFYQTWWFRLLGLALCGLAIWGMYRFRLDQVNREFALVLEERTRIARELHDTLLQGFTAVTLQVQAAADGSDIPAEARRALESAMKSADGQLREARRAVWDLRPSALESRDLITALSKLADLEPGARPIRELVVEGEPVPLQARLETAALRVAEEAVANAKQHSGAEWVRIRLLFDTGRVLLTVRDNGKGFCMKAAAGVDGHFGLHGMRERVETAGGRFTVVSAPGEGTEIEAEFLLRPTSRGSIPNFI